MPIDWNLANPMTVQQGVMQRFRDGQAIGDALREMADKREMRAALATLATDPENQQSAVPKSPVRS